jgi:hypothetical protein
LPFLEKLVELETLSLASCYSVSDDTLLSLHNCKKMKLVANKSCYFMTLKLCFEPLVCKSKSCGCTNEILACPVCRVSSRKSAFILSPFTLQLSLSLSLLSLKHLFLFCSLYSLAPLSQSLQPISFLAIPPHLQKVPKPLVHVIHLSLPVLPGACSCSASRSSPIAASRVCGPWCTWRSWF